jgi:hypothetical protein
MPLPDGMVVQANVSPRVYVIEQQQRHWVPDPYTLNLYGGWAAVQHITDANLLAIPEGARKPSRIPLTNGILLKSPEMPKVYVMENGKKRWVPDPQTLVTIGGWDRVLAMAEEDLTAIPEGPALPSVIPPGQQIQLKVDLDTNMGANHWMYTHGALRVSGHIEGTTRTRTGTWVGGFVGGMQMFYADANGIAIGQSELRTYGVDGTAVGRSDRTDYWTEDIDQAISQQVASIHVSHFWAPRWDFFGKLIAEAVRIGGPVVDLIVKIKGGGGDAK